MFPEATIEIRTSQRSDGFSGNRAEPLHAVLSATPTTEPREVSSKPALDENVFTSTDTCPVSRAIAATSSLHYDSRQTTFRDALNGGIFRCTDGGEFVR